MAVVVGVAAVLFVAPGIPLTAFRRIVGAHHRGHVGLTLPHPISFAGADHRGDHVHRARIRIAVLIHHVAN